MTNIISNIENLTLSELQLTAQKFKQQAKSIRESLKHEKTQEIRNTKYAESIDSLNYVVLELIKRYNKSEKDSLNQRDISSLLSDCYGVIGGTYREWGKFKEAASSYEAGLIYEKRVTELGGRPNSYCLVQQVVNLVLDKPKDLFTQHNQLTERLKTVRNEVIEQMKVERAGDPWAQADLALVSQLIGKEEGIDPSEEWDQLEDLDPSQYLLSTTYDVVDLLVRKLTPHLNTSDINSWEEVKSRLED